MEHGHTGREIGGDDKTYSAVFTMQICRDTGTGAASDMPRKLLGTQNFVSRKLVKCSFSWLRMKLCS
jgi:hypothetical protein